MRRLIRSMNYIFCAFAIVVLVVSTAYAQETGDGYRVVVRGWEHSGFGRLVFDGPSEVNYTATIEGGHVLVTFNKKILTDLDLAVSHLENYVTGGIITNSGRSVSFALIEDVTLSHFRNGNSIVVDIRKVFKTENKLSTKDPEIKVRVGTHSGYTRMVFDWTRPIEYSVSQEDGKAFIWFNQRARISASRLRRDLPKGYSNPKSELANNGTELSLNIPSDIQLRHFLSGDKVVVDFMTKTSSQIAIKPPAPVVAPTPPAPVVAQVAVDPAASNTDSEQTESPAKIIPDNVPANLTPPQEIIAAKTEETPSELDQISENPASAVVLPDEEEISQKEGDAPNKDAPIILTPNTETDNIVEAEANIDAAELAEVSPVEAVTTENNNLGPPPVSLSFQWPEEVGAAAFRRGSNIWIVFDRRTTIDLAPLRVEGQPVIERIEQLPISGATVLRMKTKPEFNPTAIREGFDWVFEFRRQRLVPVVQLSIDAKADADLGPQLIFPSNVPGNVIHIFDPEIGDTLRIATYKDAGFGVKGVRAYPEFQILPSAQGVVIEVFSDNLIFDRDFDGFYLSSPEGLHISAISPDSPVSTGPQLSSRRMFDFIKWSRPELPDFIEARRNFALAVTEVPLEKRNEARLDLARFYTARAAGPDAVGVLDVIEQDDPEVASRPDFRALRGAARYLNNDYENARRDFFDPRLDGFAESAIWRGAISAKLGDWKAAADQFNSGDSVLRDYPHPLKGRLGLVRTEAALATRDLRTADSWLKELDKDSELMRRGERGDLKYHQARIAMTRNDLDQATKIWEELRAGKDLRNAVRSDYSLINLGLKQDSMSRHEAIQRLDKLRYRWRGDRFELTVLRRLGEVYLEKDDYFNGLGTMRTAVTYFPDDPLAEKMAEQMTNIFHDLYIKEEADRLPPLRALAIYDEFRELTPSGPDGDLMVEKLADRLIDVDLLNRADALLQHQVQFRLQGEEKARVGAKLALVRLINDDPGSAIYALDLTNFPQIDFDLENDRRRIRAKSHFEIGEVPTAIKLLAGDVTEEADILRRDIFWKEENWTEVSKVLQRLAGDPPNDPEEGFVDDRARYILNWAVALLLNEDEEGLKALRELFGPAMANSSLADTFNYISIPVVGNITAPYEATIQQLANSENFNSFLDNYRQKYLKTSDEADTPSGSS